MGNTLFGANTLKLHFKANEVSDKGGNGVN